MMRDNNMFKRFTSYEIAGLMSMSLVCIVILIAASTLSYRALISPPIHIHKNDPGHTHKFNTHHEHPHTHPLKSHTHTIE